MNRKLNAPLVAALLILVTVSTTGQAMRAGQGMTIQTGVVVEARRVNLDSDVPKGALIGGIAGYASASGKSSSKKARNAIIGGTLGSVLVSGAQGDRSGTMYTVELAGGGSSQVVTDQNEIRVGDCVSVEQASNGAVNIRRASSSLCIADDEPLPEDLVEEISQDAAVCMAARDQLLAAQSDAEIERAAMKVNILCND